MDGILIVDKDEGKTSFDVIRDVRKKYNEKKVGHIGTLDPLASGVLPVLMGKATRLSDYLMEHSKEYIAKIKLGTSTETGDREGKIIKTQDVPKDIDAEKIQRVLEKFIGETFQIPPMYSALKVDGKKLYEIARSGKEVERKPRKIEINYINLINYDPIEKEILYKVSCSKGTYIRVLSEDIAKKLGTCGCMTYLRRTRVGNFTLDDSGKFIQLENIFQNNPRIVIKNKDELKRFLNGVKIYINDYYIEVTNPIDESINNFNDNDLQKSNLREKMNLYNVYYENEFIGIGKIEDNNIKRFIIVI